jgi:predicted RND superfamily exporter protein
MVEMSH